MTTTHPPVSSPSTNNITAYVDTLLSLTAAIKLSSLPCFSSARDTFIHELTDAQLDHIVGRLLQLDLNVYHRYRYMEWIREYVGDPNHVDFNMLSTREVMQRLAFHWNHGIEGAKGRDEVWRRQVRTAVLLGLLGGCTIYGIRDSTRTYKGLPGQPNWVKMYARVIMNRSVTRQTDDPALDQTDIPESNQRIHSASDQRITSTPQQTDDSASTSTPDTWTVRDLNGAPLNRNNPWPILRRTASGHLFQPSNPKIHTSEVAAAADQEASAHRRRRRLSW